MKKKNYSKVFDIILITLACILIVSCIVRYKEKKRTEISFNNFLKTIYLNTNGINWQETRNINDILKNKEGFRRYRKKF